MAVREHGARPLTEPLAYHGEGPYYDTRLARIVWLDMLAGDVLITDPRTGSTTRVSVDAHVVSVVRPCVTGGFVCARADRVDLLTANLELAHEALTVLPIAETARLNDGTCDGLGRLWVGSMAYDEAPGAGCMYVVDDRGRFEVVMTGVTVSNGLAFDTAGRHAAYVDSPTRTVQKLTLDGSGHLNGRDEWAVIASDIGVPDGLCLDGDGGVWVAVWDAGVVHRYDQAGRLTDVVHLPLSRPTSCALGPDGRLYVTTSSFELNAGDEPLAGSLFIADVGRPPVPLHRFGSASQRRDTPWF